MNAQNRRKSQRIHSLNTLAYNAFNGVGECVSTGMGRTLNVSRLGILLETNQPLEQEQVVSVLIEVDEKLISVTGKIMHCRPANAGLFHAGIQFDAMNRQATGVWKQYLQQWQDPVGGTPRSRSAAATPTHPGRRKPT